MAPPANQFLPPKLRDLFFRPNGRGGAAYIPSRYKIAHGGRGSGKSWGVAGVAAQLGAMGPRRILCVREVQKSIQDSVHKLLADQIGRLNLGGYYDVQKSAIRGYNGTDIIFAGIKSDPGKIKSTEAVDICLVEEAEAVSKVSWEMLVNTIRQRPGVHPPEIWVVFNPRDDVDETTKRFLHVIDKDTGRLIAVEPPNSRRVELNWSDNPWFPADLGLERLAMLDRIGEAQKRGDDDETVQLQADYDHIWEGATRKRSDAAVYRRRVVVESFDEPPHGTRLFFGADWGFSVDPTAGIRFWITEHKDERGRAYQEIWISHEAFGWKTEMDEIPDLFDAMLPDVRKWPIKGDCAQPMIISYLARQGFNITPAEKWQGSVEDGIAHVKAFRRIHIHTRCKHIAQEARLYSYKIDRVTQQILPVLVDANNHGWDAVRYGLDGYIQRRGVHAQWAKLAQ